MSDGRTKQPEGDDRGLRCRQCNHGRFRVIYTRHARGGKVVRRRECRECGTRVTTWERAVGDKKPVS